jgi:hypothetical protein
MRKIKSPRYRLYNANNIEALARLPDNSVHAVVTDPPYGLGKEPDAYEMVKQWYKTGHYNHSSKRGFMGNEWDAFVPQPAFWKEVFRVLKPGGYVVSFFGTRTYDIGTLAIRMAGFQIRDQLAWLYGQGFPKSLNVGKAIDKHVGAKPTVVGKRQHPTLKDKSKVDRQGKQQFHGSNSIKDEWDLTKPTSKEALLWDGWGTALKPALEPIVLAQKPFDGTYASNLLKHGVGALNIDDCRIEANSKHDDPRLGGKGSWKTDKMAKSVYEGGYSGTAISSSASGRFPANVIHDGSFDVVSRFPTTKSGTGAVKRKTSKGSQGNALGKESRPAGTEMASYGDEGSASRFFYCAKTNKKDRNEGLDKPSYVLSEDTPDLIRRRIEKLLCK